MENIIRAIQRRTKWTAFSASGKVWTRERKENGRSWGVVGGGQDRLLERIHLFTSRLDISWTTLHFSWYGHLIG